MKSRRSLLMLAFACAVLSLGLAVGCGRDDDANGGGTAVEATEAETDPADVTVLDILEDPELYAGELVTVTGPVEDVVVDPGAFTIGERQTGDPAEQQIVIFPTLGSGVPGTIAEGDEVSVSGTVHVITTDIFSGGEFLFEEATQRDELIEDFLDQPAIIASDITRNRAGDN